MIILGKIKVDDQVFKYCEISYEPFYVTIMSEDEKAIVDLFNSAKSIIVMDQYGLAIKSITNYCGVESSTIKYNFYLDEENNMKPVITVRLKAVDLNEKIKSIEAAMGEDTVDESSMSLEEYRAYKIKQYGVECQDKIYAGTDVETSYGTEHFSATGDDQANIKTLSDVAMATKVSLPYHADGSQCKVYTYQDIIKIYCEIQKLILAETSYCNALNSYLSMFILGGICFIYCGLQNEKTSWDYPFWKQLAKSEAFVLIAEFLTGCVLNLWLGLGIWDYSNLPGNILGQTSWQFALLFLPVCAFGIILDDYLRYWFFNEDEPHYNFKLK